MPTDDSNDRQDASTWAHLGKILSPIRWDWPGWLPRGFLTLLASQPGAGKSLFCLRLAAVYLRQEDQPAVSWPDGAPFSAPPGKVIWCESEAGHALNVDRARRLGIDLSRVLSPLPHPLFNFKLDDPAHVAALTHHARRPGVSLVVLDSLRGLRSGGRKSASINKLLLDLADLARIAGKPVLLTHHLRKRTTLDDASGPSVDSLLGSAAIAQSARVIWALDNPDPLRPHHRRLSVIKNNLARYPDPLGMTVTEDGHLHFGPPPQPAATTSQLDRAAAFLVDLLTPGPLPFEEIERHARAAGYALPTLRRAKSHLGVASVRLPGQSTWHWTLPTNE